MRFSLRNTAFLLLSPPLAALLGFLFIRQHGFPVAAWLPLVAMYWATGLAITAGYHRCFSHRAYEASRPLQLLYLLIGAGAVQNSLLYWASNHRYHHRHVDQDGDPYNIRKGFWWAHFAWMFYEEPPGRPFRNVPDLRKNPLVMWQHRHYVSLSLVFGFGLPALMGAALGNTWAGLLWGGFIRMVLLHQFIFTINSVAHYFGKPTHAPDCSARDSWWLPYISFGEGYHSYHHAYPSDYRNGVAWYHWDPSKWFVFTMKFFGLTRELKRSEFPGKA